MTTLGMFENFLDDPVMMESDLKSDKMDLLSTSIHESGLFNEGSEDWRRISGLETDALLDSILTGANDEIQGEGSLDRPLSDTSSDSGCNFDQQQILSPEPSSASNKVDLIEYISNPEDDEDSPLHAVVNPRTNSPEPADTVFDTGATTIILPVITPVQTIFK